MPQQLHEFVLAYTLIPLASSILVNENKMDKIRQIGALRYIQRGWTTAVTLRGYLFHKTHVSHRMRLSRTRQRAVKHHHGFQRSGKQKYKALESDSISYIHRRLSGSIRFPVGPDTSVPAGERDEDLVRFYDGDFDPTYVPLGQKDEDGDQVTKDSVSESTDIVPSDGPVHNMWTSKRV